METHQQLFPFALYLLLCCLVFPFAESSFCPEGQFQCTSSKLCIDAERRCNGVADCGEASSQVHHEKIDSFASAADYSDELNCTSALCRPEKGAYLCSDGRCILSPWSCDSCSDEKGSHCVKNSVITAAIIGSLVCLLLIVIAISCAIRLFGLRVALSGRGGQGVHYRSSLATSGLYSPGGNGHGHGHCQPTFDSLPFPPPLGMVGTVGDLDASLFRNLDHSVFLREPPPSYASTMGGYGVVDVPVNGGGALGAAGTASYMEQYRRYRRQRRCRRLLRRQQRLAAQSGGGCGVAAGAVEQPQSDLGGCTSSPTEEAAHPYHEHGHQFVNPLPALSPTDISLQRMHQLGNHSAALPSSVRITLSPSAGQFPSFSPQAPPLPLPSLDCDSQPLIRD